MTNKSLLLVWRSKETELYYHVGTLTYDEDFYTFEYTHHSDAKRKVNDAINHGYVLHPAFPHLTKKYKSKTLFPSFARRNPSENRVDYEEILNKLSLTSEADQMDVLRATRGMIGSNPYFFAEPLRLSNDNILSNHFYISGMRYRSLSDSWFLSLNIGDKLLLKHDYNNPVDPNAIKIFTMDGKWLGFVPGIFAKAIRALLERNVEMSVIIDEINPTYNPQQWVHVSFQSILDKGQLTEEIDGLEGLFFKAA